MNITSMIVLLLALAIASGCATTAQHSVKDEQVSAPVAGGYSSVDVSDSEVKLCAQWAVEQQEPKGSVRLESITSARRQVVAGMNYQLSLEVSRSGSTEHVTATVWVKLDGSRELTSWESHRH